MTPAEQAVAIRRGVGLFRLTSRALVGVTGSEATRWLDGMISNQVTELTPGSSRSGCYATLLTPQGRIIADLHVMRRAEGFWLELDAAVVADVLARLEKFIIADDVSLVDATARWRRWGLEGPAAGRLLEQALGAPVELSADCATAARLGEAELYIARFGWTGELAYQLFVPADAEAAVVRALREAGAPLNLVEGEPEALEILRIESGTPRLGAELDEQVLPPEARLERAISTTKGCYTGQEIIARIRSRGQVGHLLVGLACAGDAVPEAGDEIRAGGKVVGEVTSAVDSPHVGPIALGFVRRAQAEAGTRLAVGAHEAEVVELPFVDPTTPVGGAG